MKRWLFLFLVCSTSAALAAQDAKLGCMQLRIVLDSRLSAATVEQAWGSGNPRSEAPATLELVGCNGAVLDRFALDAPLAQLDPLPVRGAPHPTFLVSTDLTVEAGSYNGPLTVPIQVVREKLLAATVKAPDQSTQPIRLSMTGKSAWRRVPGRHSGRHVDELLLVSCQPRDQRFVTSYRRYVPAHPNWQVKVRTVDGLWESDGEFPARKRFP